MGGGGGADGLAGGWVRVYARQVPVYMYTPRETSTPFCIVQGIPQTWFDILFCYFVAFFCGGGGGIPGERK